MEKNKVVTQLRRIEGQLRGIAAMVEGDRGLVATTQQFMAAHSSLRKAMKQYVQLFLRQTEEGTIEITQEQLEYILKMIDA